MKTNMYLWGSNGYRSEDGHQIKRESGETPNGNDMALRWVLRDNKGEFIDYDQYRHDLAERHGFDLKNYTNTK